MEPFELGDHDPRLSTVRRYALVVGAVVTHDVQANEQLALRSVTCFERSYRVEHEGPRQGQSRPGSVEPEGEAGALGSAAWP